MDIRDLRPPVEDGPWPPLTHFPPLDYSPLRSARSWVGQSFALVDGYRPMVLDLHVPQGVPTPPVVLWVHGGGWSEGDRRHVPLQWGQQRMFQRLLDAGIAVATPDYRLVAESRLPGPVHDIVAAVRWLRHYADRLGVDGDRIALWGDSAGAHLAAVAGLAAGAPAPDPWLLGDIGVGGDIPADVRAIVWWYGVSDLTSLPSLVREHLWPGTPEAELPELARRLSPVSYLRADSPPLLAMMGDGDSLVPIDQAHRLDEAARAVGTRCEVHISPGSEHVFHGEEIEPYWDQAISFLVRELGHSGNARPPASSPAR